MLALQVFLELPLSKIVAGVGETVDLGSSRARLFGALAGFFGALLGALLGALFGGFLGYLLRGLLHGFLHGFLCSLLGGFFGCFFRHNISPESRGFRNETQAKCFVPLVMARLQSP